jgi:glutamyl-tRNA(Gln) amidotransferase subunit E
MDYQNIGFKAGLEIHQQLDTHKLFCHCTSKITEDIDYSFERVLRPTQSELGDVDKAALEEAKRKRRFLYTASHLSTCLVEADEEPPHQANEEAVDICLTIARLLDAKTVDEIHFMRKIVIDGSNTTGFQRTALIAMHGMLEGVGIDTLALEEDSARKLTEKDKLVNYGLDRLGMPLIEIATAPDITKPQQVRHVAEQLGLLLRATKQVKRGLGTIRQDLNVSIAQGARVEIKGIQSLSSLSKVAETEARRQQGMIEIRKILLSRIQKKDLDAKKSQNLTSLFKTCSSHLVQKQLKKNGCAKGIILPGFSGLLKRKDTRFGKELAVFARLSSGIGGILHSDELPAYGITKKEVKKIHTVLHTRAHDAFVLAIGKEAVVDTALDAVLIRAKYVFDGVLEAVRRSLPDNTTEYMRPLPGAARMYPETDVPPIRITKDRIQQLSLPEKPQEKYQRFLAQYHLHHEQAKQLLASGYEDDFERLVQLFPKLTNVITRTFLNTLPELEAENISIEGIDDTLLKKLFSALSEGKFAKEAIPTLLKYQAIHPRDSLDKALTTCGFGVLSEQEIKTIITKVVQERISFVKKKGMDSVGPLMGIVMKELRGKADGKLISNLLAKEIQRTISS